MSKIPKDTHFLDIRVLSKVVKVHVLCLLQICEDVAWMKTCDSSPTRAQILAAASVRRSIELGSEWTTPFASSPRRLAGDTSHGGLSGFFCHAAGTRPNTRQRRHATRTQLARASTCRMPSYFLRCRCQQEVIREPPSSHDFLAVFSLSLLYRFIFEDVSGLTTHVSKVRKRDITDANKPWSPPSQTLSLPLDRFSLGSAQGIRRHPPVCLARGSPAEWRKAALCRARIAKETPKDQVRRNAKLLPNICYPRSKHRHPRLIIVASRRPLDTIYPAFARRDSAKSASGTPSALQWRCTRGSQRLSTTATAMQVVFLFFQE